MLTLFPRYFFPYPADLFSPETVLLLQKYIVCILRHGGVCGLACRGVHVECGG